MLIKETFVEDVPEPYRPYKHGRLDQLIYHLIIDNSLDFTEHLKRKVCITSKLGYQAVFSRLYCQLSIT